MTSFSLVYPFICLGFLSAPIVIQFVASHGYSLRSRVAFCSIPLLALAGLSSPLANHLNVVSNVGPLQIVHPMEYCLWKYERNLELVDIIGRDMARRRHIGAVKSEDQQHSPANGSLPFVH